MNAPRRRSCGRIAEATRRERKHMKYHLRVCSTCEFVQVLLPLTAAQDIWYWKHVRPLTYIKLRQPTEGV